MELTEAVEWLRGNRGFGPETDLLSVQAVRRAADTITLEILDVKTAAERLDISPQTVTDILDLLGEEGFEDFYVRRGRRSGFFIERIPDADD